MKFFAILAFLAIIFADCSFAQQIQPGVANQPNPALTARGDQKLLSNRRPSSGGGPPETITGIRARLKPSAGASSANTSYSTITNAPPGATPNSAASNSLTRLAPQSPRLSRRATGVPVDPLSDAFSSRGLPESMRIQQETVRALPPPAELITRGGAPSVVNSSIERDRIDASAPSQQRLQIDDLSGVRAQQQKAGTPFSSDNPPVNGVSSINGSSNGMSGTALPAARIGTGTLSRPRSLARSPGIGTRSSGRSSSSGGSR
jgi:hypothetical protein